MRCSRSKARTICALVRRIEALGKFLDTEDGKNLLAGYKRATNIIRIEEKKDAREYVGKPDPQLYRQAEEWELAKAIDRSARRQAPRSGAKISPPPCARWRSCGRMWTRSSTRSRSMPTTSRVRENRLRLLNEIRAATRAVADFSRIEGG